MGKITRLFVTWSIIVLIGVFFYKHYNQNGLNGHPSTKNDLPAHQKVDAKNGLQNLIGADSKQIQKKFGKPSRTEPSAYGYDWWIYNKDPEDYMQVGMEDGKVVTLFAFGRNLNTGDLTINGKRKDVLKGIKTSSSVSLNYGINSYRFELNSDDLKARPLVRIGQNWAILYFDNFTDRLAGIRYLNAKTLVKLQPYSLSYRGTLLQPKDLSRADWQKVEAGEDRGILDMTNVIRTRFGLSTLKWNDKAAGTAFGHSKDMAVHHYFAHTSPTEGTVGERLHRAGINYLEAGENIAYNYPDAIAAMFGWLNSKGHRENLLHKAYTGLGVGVYEKEYTQDFVKPF